MSDDQDVAKHRILAGPLGRRIAKTSNANAPGNRPWTAACTSLGARNAGETIILTCRMLHSSRTAICSTLTAPATI